MNFYIYGAGIENNATLIQNYKKSKLNAYKEIFIFSFCKNKCYNNFVTLMLNCVQRIFLFLAMCN